MFGSLEEIMNIDETTDVNWKTLIQLLAAVAALWALSGFALYWVEQRGTFGDMFGAINALFSGLAFASLVYTILLQRTELQLQRNELKYTREELEGQKIQLAAQNEAMRMQNFENAFFQLLKLLNEIISSIDLQTENRQTHGRDCFSIFYTRFATTYRKHRSGNPEGTPRAITNDAYEKFYETHQGELGHYFRTLYNIVKFVHQSNVENKKFYTNLVRAQLSSQEILLLFYNCLSKQGEEKFKPLVEKYSLLKMLPKNLVASQDQLEWYLPTAYGSNV